MCDVGEVVRDVGPLIGLAGVGLTLWFNGRREDQRRRREDHARAIEAAEAYLQMPYRIRRRRPEAATRSSERTRLSDDFSAIQAELSSCESLIRSDKKRAVRDAYAGVVETLREHAGEAATIAWNDKPVAEDSDMGQSDLHATLAPVRERLETCELTMAKSTRRIWWS